MWTAHMDQELHLGSDFQPGWKVLGGISFPPLPYIADFIPNLFTDLLSCAGWKGY